MHWPHRKKRDNFLNFTLLCTTLSPSQWSCIPPAQSNFPPEWAERGWGLATGGSGSQGGWLGGGMDDHWPSSLLGQGSFVIKEVMCKGMTLPSMSSPPLFIRQGSHLWWHPEWPNSHWERPKCLCRDWPVFGPEDQVVSKPWTCTDSKRLEWLS